MCESVNSNDIKGCMNHDEEWLTYDMGLADFVSHAGDDLLKHYSEGAEIDYITTRV